LGDALGERAGLLDRRARDQHDELLPAVPGDEVARPRVLLQDRGHLLQRLVAVRVSEAVVDRLETVEVHHEEGERQTVAVGALDLGGQGLLEVPVVIQAREAVRHGAPPQILGGARVLEGARRDVGEHLEHLEGRLVRDAPVDGVVDVEQPDHLVSAVEQRHEERVVRVEHARAEIRKRPRWEVELLLWGHRVARMVDEAAVAVAELVAEEAANDGAGDRPLAHDLVVLWVLPEHGSSPVGIVAAVLSQVEGRLPELQRVADRVGGDLRDLVSVERRAQSVTEVHDGFQPARARLMGDRGVTQGANASVFLTVQEVEAHGERHNYQRRETELQRPQGGRLLTRRG